MEKIKQKINLENMLLVFIIILPLLDMLSFTFRNKFYTNISPSTFIRPIIPIIAITMIFFKNHFKMKSILVACMYGIYAVIHIAIFILLKSESSYGSIYSETQYIMNYSFMVLNLFIYTFVFQKEDSLKLKRSILIANIIYIVSIYVAWITKTSSTTYLEGIGIKGWFESGNSLCSIFILGLFILLTMLKSDSGKWKISKAKIGILLIIILIGIFLTLLVGTRVGLFGFVIVLGTFLLVEIVFHIKNKIHIDKKFMIVISAVIIIIVGFVAIKGSNTLQRRAYLKNLDSGIIDSKTGEPSHVTGDILTFKEKIEQGTLSKSFLPEPNQKAIVSLYEYANKHEISLTDSRMQQLVYNAYLVKYQNNLGLVLFGNGYQINYAELILEMEIPAFLLNFGLIGFILYFMPFLGICLYALYMGIKNREKIDSEFVIYFLGFAFSFVLSLFAGYTFFNASTMMVIIVIGTLLINKCREIR